MIELWVAGIALDPGKHQPVVVLQDQNMNALPIWIGFVEAATISTILQHEKLSRPRAHELLLNVITEMGYSVERIEIDFLDATTYRGTIKLTKAGSWGKRTKTKSIDARPSDAIAVALAAKARIFITPGVAEKHLLSLAPPKDDDESFKQFLTEVKASDFKLSGSSSGEA